MLRPEPVLPVASAAANRIDAELLKILSSSSLIFHHGNFEADGVIVHQRRRSTSLVFVDIRLTTRLHETSREFFQSVPKLEIKLMGEPCLRLKTAGIKINVGSLVHVKGTTLERIQKPLANPQDLISSLDMWLLSGVSLFEMKAQRDTDGNVLNENSAAKFFERPIAILPKKLQSNKDLLEVLGKDENEEIEIHQQNEKKTKKEEEYCKLFLNSGKCPYGIHCAQRHPIDPEELKLARNAYVAARHQKVFAPREGSGEHKELLPRSQRAKMFVEWLITTYDLKTSRPSSPQTVYDVAGGSHGEVSFNLRMLSQVECTLVEPRERKLTKFQRRELESRFGREAIRRLDESDAAQLSKLLGPHRRELFYSNDEWHTLLRKDARLVVGLHPDQATEAIVDAAIAAGVPFAVMPCCVFPKLFPNRVHDGKPVVTYAQFLSYLRAKVPPIGMQINVARLGFAGSDTIIYSKHV